MLNRLTVKGFKSIEDSVLDLKSLNVIIGPNGAGKSNLLSLFRLAKAMADGNLSLWVGLAGGADSLLHFGSARTETLAVGLDWDGLGYFCEFKPTEDDRLVIAYETILQSGGAMGALGPAGASESALANASRGLASTPGAADIASWFSGFRVYHFHDTSDSSGMRRNASMHDNRWLREGGENLAAYLLMLRDTASAHYARIVDVVRLAVPAFRDFELAPHPKAETVLLRWRHRFVDAVFGPHQLSDGSLRFMALATLLLQPEPPNPILLDEPEIGLHPHALVQISEMLALAALDTQVLAATQSPLLVDRTAPEDVLVLDAEHGKTLVRRPDVAGLQGWLDDYTLGELWRKNVLGGNP